MLTRLYIKIHTNSKDEKSVMIMHDGYLIAILVFLQDAVHGPACGRWCLKAQFDHLPLTGQLFRTIDEAERWIDENMQTRTQNQVSHRTKLSPSINHSDGPAVETGRRVNADKA